MTNARFHHEAFIGHEIDIHHNSWREVEEIYGRSLSDEVRGKLASATCIYAEMRQGEVVPKTPTGRVGAGAHLPKILNAILKSIRSFNEIKEKDNSIYRKERTGALKGLQKGARSEDEIKKIEDDAEERAGACANDYRDAYQIAIEMIDEPLRNKGLHFPIYQFIIMENEIKKIIDRLKINPGQYGAFPGEAWERWVLSIKATLKEAGLPAGTKNFNIDPGSEDNTPESLRGRFGYLDRLCFALMREFVPDAQQQHAGKLPATADAVRQTIRIANKAHRANSKNGRVGGI